MPGTSDEGEMSVLREVVSGDPEKLEEGRS